MAAISLSDLVTSTYHSGKINLILDLLKPNHCPLRSQTHEHGHYEYKDYEQLIGALEGKSGA
jgi:hypothetical protein